MLFEEMPRCCVDCFAHEWLRDYVRESSSERGNCDYCDREDVAVLGVGALYGPFRNLLQLYVPSNSPHGAPLVDLIQDTHEVFDDDLHTSDESARLLGDILDAGWDDDSGEPRVDPRELYYPASHTGMSDAWNEFCERAKADPNHELDLPEMFEEDVGHAVVVLPAGTLLHRARLGFVEGEYGVARPYEGTDIGPPPSAKTREGRANGAGEVVLYLADQEQTAVAEVRPWRGLLVSVAEMRTRHDLQLVDLSESPSPPNPFTEEALGYWMEFTELLAAFGEELGRPLRRADDPADYIPCQKLVRYIRDTGFYHGIRYPSAMTTDGTNVVLFDPAVVEIGASKVVEVKEIGMTYGPPDDE